MNPGSDNRKFSAECCVKDVRKSAGFSLEESGFFEKIIFAGPSGMPCCLVMPDADSERSAELTARRAFLNGGQYCTTIKRAFVYRRLYPDFMDHLLRAVDKIKVGDPLDPETDYGPIKVKRTRGLLERVFKWKWP